MTDANVYRPDQLLKDAAKHSELVVFVGAGASMLCGSPDWRGFANHVVGALEKTGGLSFLEAEQLRGLGDPRRTLSIAMALAKEQNVTLDFDDILHPSKQDPVGAELYKILSSLRPVFVTTNYDRWLDEEGPEVVTDAPTGEESKPTQGPISRPKYYLKEHLTSGRLAERGAVIHLHGSCAEPSSMVVSLKDYIEHYADPRVQNFLSEMFRSHTVLFVGYGLAEMEVLDYIVRSNKSISSGSAEPRHFILYAHRSNESVQTKFIERFFRDQCGVQVIPYCIDTKGYGELVEVFKSWESQLDVRDPTLLDLQSRLDRYVATAEPSQRESAVGLVLKHPELTAYFLNSLKDPVWFDDLEGAGFFRVENNPEVKEIQSDKGILYQADGWPALRYLEHVAPLVNSTRANRVAEIVRMVTADSMQRSLDNWRTWWSLATIMSHLPLEVIDESDIELARSWLMGRFEANMVGHELGGRLLPRLLDSADPVDWKKAMTLVDALATLRNVERMNDSYHLGEALKPSARRLGARCGSAAVAMLAKRFEQYMGSPDEDLYSYIWRSAIEDHEQDAHKDGFRTVLVDALRDAALGATGTQTEDALASTRGLLQSPFPTVVRVGIYVCGEHYANVGRTFWENVKSDWLVALVYWHELFWFIKKAFPRFSASERTRFLTLVDQFEGEWKDESRRDERDETHRRDLLHPAVGLGDADVDARYKDLVERRGPVREYPDFHHMRSRWVTVGERSPVTSDTLVGMADADLMALLSDFVPDSRGWDGPTYRGLVSTLSAAVRASDDGFASRISLFADSARSYQHGLLSGLKERWADDKHDIDWPAALLLMRTIAAAPAFKNDLDAEPGEGREPSVQWVVSDISDLIKAGSSADRQLSPELLLHGLEILQLVLSVTKPDDTSESKDAVSHAINSSRGRALETVINVALALRRQEVASGQHEGRVWTLVLPILEAELTSSELGRNADFAALAGMYCANLHYLNSDWVEQNFDRLFSTSNDSAWRCAAQGFAYQQYFYDWLFRKLNGSGHLRKMVFAEGLPDSVAEKALQFLGLAYLGGIEQLTGKGLLAELIVTLKSEQLSQLCWFFWTLRGGQERAPSRAALMLGFWERVAEVIRARNEIQAELQSALGLLAVFIEELTPPTLQMWVEVAPHAQVRHHGYILVEHMARLAGRNPAAIADVFRSALTGFLPDFKAEEVIRCVKALADAGRVDDAEWICNEYARRGSTLLKELYETLRASQRTRPTDRNDRH